MKYATIDTNGLPTGFYSDDVHGKNIPKGTKQMSDADWQAHINGDLRRWAGKAWVQYAQPKPTAAELTTEANAKIKVQMDALDLKRIRPLAEGDTVYLAKLNTQAVALRARLK